jgi:protein-L-isoaspartate(D-aspartate) O-methyltransferase
MSEPSDSATDPLEEEFARRRQAMVRDQLASRGIRDPAVLEAMGTIPRERFVPPYLRERAYIDAPLPLDSATISQPYIVAFMTELAHVEPGKRVLEVGTGSGYQAAILAELGADVYTIEVRAWMMEGARRVLTSLGYDQIHFRHGNGWLGWPQAAPFDAIIVTAAPPEIPQALPEQLAEGGRLVIPVGPRYVQDLVVATRVGDGLQQRSEGSVAFVPLVRYDDELE